MGALGKALHSMLQMVDFTLGVRNVMHYCEMTTQSRQGGQSTGTQMTSEAFSGGATVSTKIGVVESLPIALNVVQHV